MVKDVGGFGHFHHEGGLAGGQVVHGAEAGEDPIGDADVGRAGWYLAADLGQQLNQFELAQLVALAAGVGAGEHYQISAAAESHVVGGERGYTSSCSTTGLWASIMDNSRLSTNAGA